jgi:K+-transporting ATPase ATPase C chain
VARARGLGEGEVRRRVREATEGPQWGFLGESRVNVLRLNLALDAARP